MILQDESVDLDTPFGSMLTYIYRPVAPGRYPGLVFYSEIFQQTEPIRRAASILAGHGFVVAVPEIFHELNPRGTVLGYDQPGKDKGNDDKITKTIESYDADTAAVLSYLKSSEHCSGKLGAMGICIGGHLAFRAAMHPEVAATVCLYATDIHSRTLGKGKSDNSLDRLGDINGEIMMIWGKQDPHIPTEGRAAIYQAMSAAELNFTWHEFNAQHAFLRDEGARYDPELSLLCYNMAISLFRRKLGEGDLAADPKVIDGSC